MPSADWRANIEMYLAIARALGNVDPAQLQAALNTPRYHVSHPLRWILEGACKPDLLQGQVLGNTERALRTFAVSGTTDSWLSAKVREAVEIPERDDFGDIYSRL
ncbi:MAG: hypothetical protein PHZ19_07335, partial [Candidatus Thermoplasmatota archaeon]|nr:hypothetical protein [Candidatus Thermoplasmatota archaeon]